jgi:SpoIIAA-like
MIEILQQSTEDCLAVHFSGKVNSVDYQQFLEALKERLKTGSPINLVVELSGFEFYGDFEAAKQDARFAFGEYKHIHRAAFVGDQKWIEWFTRLVGPFTRAEEKQFPAGQLGEAFRWASEDA